MFPFFHRIDCLADQSTPICCSKLNVQASRGIHKTQGARLGVYKQIGELNNHPLYHLSQFNYQSYLYFRTEGIGKNITLSKRCPTLSPFATCHKSHF